MFISVLSYFFFACVQGRIKKTKQIWEGNTEATKGLEMKERLGKKRGLCVRPKNEL